MNYTCRLCHFSREHCQCAPSKEALLVAHFAADPVELFFLCMIKKPLAVHKQMWHNFMCADASRI